MVKYALDCEMVAGRYRSLLARVSIVNENGQVVLDTYVRPIERVTDYRTHVSGIEAHHLNNGESFYKVQSEVISLLRGNILIGHSLQFDLAALSLDHPERSKRDLAFYRPLQSNGQPTSLKELSRQHLGIDIQTGLHSSAEDAKAAMNLYLKFARQWENSL